MTDNGDERASSPSAAITEAKQYRNWAPKAKAPANGEQKQPTIAAAIATKSDSAAAKALEGYHVATSRYLVEAGKLDEAEQRVVDAQARVASLHEVVSTVLTTMAEARAKLDHELSLLTPSGEPKPFSQRVKVRLSTLEERACDTCGSTFQPNRRTQHSCSSACKQKAMHLRSKAEREVSPAAEPEAVPV